MELNRQMRKEGEFYPTTLHMAEPWQRLHQVGTVVKAMGNWTLVECLTNCKVRTKGKFHLKLNPSYN